MNGCLQLSHVRTGLVRLEETIIFALIERAQFRHNSKMYERGAFPAVCGEENLVGYLLYETEKVHAKMRRYTSPDEHPFFDNLPAPILPALRYDRKPLHPNAININNRIRAAYEAEIVPLICQDGDDQQYGSSAVSDVNLLQSLSKRIHFGKFVAESKYQSAPAAYDRLIHAYNSEGIMESLTEREVEEQVLQRVGRKAAAVCKELNAAGSDADYHVDPRKVVAVYEDWIVPYTKDVQVMYLLGRLNEPRQNVSADEQ